MDIEDVIPGDSYTLEVSSPGLERKLSKAKDFERFVGQKAKVVLREPVENQRSWEGKLAGISQGVLLWKLPRWSQPPEESSISRWIRSKKPT